jgi:hypothetical protein
MNLDLTDEEAAALIRELREITDSPLPRRRIEPGTTTRL